ncbi:hypothetical protein KSD_16350 [Ktedonobacter sp. SOSP1-85]|nr:hypothetical protein KSD_16350 [Ktedonobacter sp. SOSP1-85]
MAQLGDPVDFILETLLLNVGIKSVKELNNDLFIRIGNGLGEVESTCCLPGKCCHKLILMKYLIHLAKPHHTKVVRNKSSSQDEEGMEYIHSPASKT